MDNKFVKFVIGAVLLLILPFFAQYFGNGWVRIIDAALLYMMLALGLNIVVGYAGLLDLGYVAFYAVGAYMLGLLASPHLTDTFDWFKHAFTHGLHAPVWLVIPLGALVAGTFGVLLGALLLSALPEVLRYVAGPLQELSGGRLDSAILRQLLIALAMIGVMLSRPRGLWPSPEHGKAAPAPAAVK